VHRVDPQLDFVRVCRVPVTPQASNPNPSRAPIQFQGDKSTGPDEAEVERWDLPGSERPGAVHRVRHRARRASAARDLGLI
jgi:hypothetical protein